MSSKSRLSRRDFLGGKIKRSLQAQRDPVPVMRFGELAPQPPVSLSANSDQPKVARIHNEHCLPFCSLCREHCPIAGAIVVHNAERIVVPGLCDGCDKCRDVCPAPLPAITLELRL